MKLDQVIERQSKYPSREEFIAIFEAHPDEVFTGAELCEKHFGEPKRKRQHSAMRERARGVLPAEYCFVKNGVRSFFGMPENIKALREHFE